MTNKMKNIVGTENIRTILISNTIMSKTVNYLLSDEPQFTFIHYKFNESLIDIFMKIIATQNKNVIYTQININFCINLFFSLTKKCNYKPFDYQIEAYNILKNQKKSSLNMTCGMGKTFVAIMIAKNYKNIIILSPQIIYADQLLKRFQDHFNDYETNLITGKTNKIIQNELLGEKNIFSVTYKSANKIINLLKQQQTKSINDFIIIIDEYHHLSFNNLYNKNDSINWIINSDYKILYLSATPKMYNIIDTNTNTNTNTNSDVQNILNNETIFGKVKYEYNFDKAIKNNYINKYELLISDPTEKLDKYEYIYNKMKYYGYSKCIIFNRNTEEAKIMFDKLKEIHNRIKIVNDFYLEIVTSKINGSKKRETILEQFSYTTSEIAIIVSVKMFDECIDIPQCDSVYFAYEPSSKISIIQRISRCLRKSPNKNNVSGIFIFEENGKNITNILEEMKEFNMLKHVVNIKNINQSKYIHETEKLYNNSKINTSITNLATNIGTNISTRMEIKMDTETKKNNKIIIKDTKEKCNISDDIIKKDKITNEIKYLEKFTTLELILICELLNISINSHKITKKTAIDMLQLYKNITKEHILNAINKSKNYKYVVKYYHFCHKTNYEYLSDIILIANEKEYQFQINDKTQIKLCPICNRQLHKYGFKNYFYEEIIETTKENIIDNNFISSEKIEKIENKTKKENYEILKIFLKLLTLKQLKIVAVLCYVFVKSTDKNKIIDFLCASPRNLTITDILNIIKRSSTNSFILEQNHICYDNYQKKSSVYLIKNITDYDSDKFNDNNNNNDNDNNKNNKNKLKSNHICEICKKNKNPKIHYNYFHSLQICNEPEEL
jgi:superfamily II DNA or RNA helicase